MEQTMTQAAFENELKYEIEWHTFGLTQEQYDFLCEQASYMSERDRAFFIDTLKDLMRVYQ
jgi:molybdate-binding protein